MKRTISILLILLISITLFSCDEEKKNNKSNNNKTKNNNNYVEEETTIYLPTVSFNTNGGSDITSFQTDVISYEPKTTKENHVFDGWYLDSTFNSPVTYPLEIKYDTVLHAKWLLIKSETKCEDTDIQLSADFSNISTYSITPNGFDMNKLETLGYNMTITVTYDVYYTKTYDVLWDIGYAGAPKYEATLLDSDLLGDSDLNVEATKETKTKELKYTKTISDIKNKTFKLTFHTNNVQNIVRFENIKVTYECYK